MIKVENINKGAGRCDLVSDRFDCGHKGFNTANLLYHEKKCQKEFRLTESKKTLQLDDINYIRNSEEFFDIFVDGVPVPKGSSVVTMSQSGLLTNNSGFFRKGSIVVVKYIHDFDSTKGISVYPWMLVEGGDCAINFVDSKNSIVTKFDSRTKDPLYFYRFTKCRVAKLIETNLYNKSVEFGKIKITFDKKSVQENDKILITKEKDMVIFQPTNENSMLFEAKKC